MQHGGGRFDSFFLEMQQSKRALVVVKLVFPNVMDRLSSFKEMVWCLLMDEKSSSENLELLLTCVGIVGKPE